MTVTFGTRTGTPTWSADSDTFTRLQLDQGFSTLELIAAITSEGPIGGRPAFGKGGAFYLATDQSVLYYDTGSAWIVAGRVVIGTQVAQAAALQTASLTEWRDSAGNVLGKVAVDGSLLVNKLRFATAAKNNLTPITPTGGVTTTGAAFGYRMTVDGWCEIQGGLAPNGFGGGGLSAGGTVPLPADGLPHLFMAASSTNSDGTAPITPVSVTVLAFGALYCSAVPAGTAYLSLDGIRYYVGG